MMDMETLTSLCGEATKDFRLGERFHVGQVRKIVEELWPKKGFKDNSYYEALDKLSELGYVKAGTANGRRSWIKREEFPEQLCIGFGENGHPDQGEWDRAKPGEVQGAVLRVVRDEPLRNGTYTAKDVQVTVRSRNPGLFAKMSPNSVGTALANLEHRGVVRRTGEKDVNRIVWETVPNDRK